VRRSSGSFRMDDFGGRSHAVVREADGSVSRFGSSRSAAKQGYPLPGSARKFLIPLEGGR